MNAVLNESSRASGGPSADYRVSCSSSGLVGVGSFVAPAGTVDFDAVVQAARNAGFTSPSSDYTIFYDAPNPAACGTASMAIDLRPGAENLNNSGGGYAVNYDGCWYGRTPMHENGHNQGAVQPGAPMSDMAAHCLEGHDVMCYTSNVTAPVFCPATIWFDCGFDTYFDSAPEPGEWLSMFWNIGSRVNRFIEFGP